MKVFDWNEFKEEKIAIEVSNDKECEEFLSECEKNGINWNDKRATLFIPYTPTSIACGFSRKGVLGYSRSGFFKEEGYEIIKWSDIKNNLREEIIIYRNGNEVIALHKENGETIKSAKAKCNPEDEFNFNLGAKLAFERLMNDGTKDDLHDFKVGEVVKIIGRNNWANHYFPIGTVVEIKNVYEGSKILTCYGHTVYHGNNGFNEQTIKMEDVEKINN